MKSPFHLEEFNEPIPLPDQEPLPHHNNVERVERRIAEIHLYWRQTAPLITVGFLSFVAASALLAIWAFTAAPKADTQTRYALCGGSLLLVLFVVLVNELLRLAKSALQKSDRTINALEEEIQRITSSPGYVLNKEVMPLEFYLKALGLMRTMVYLLLPIWLLLPTLLLFFSKPNASLSSAKTTLSKLKEPSKRGKN